MPQFRDSPNRNSPFAPLVDGTMTKGDFGVRKFTLAGVAIIAAFSMSACATLEGAAIGGAGGAAVAAASGKSVEKGAAVGGVAGGVVGTAVGD